MESNHRSSIMSNQSLASFVSSGDSAIMSRRLSSALISGEALMTMKRECHRRSNPSTSFDRFFSDFFFASAWTFRLTTWKTSRKNARKNTIFFLKNVLTTCAGYGYNGVSQGDTPTPPPPPRGGGGGGGSSFRAKEVGTLYAVPYCITIRG